MSVSYIKHFVTSTLQICLYLRLQAGAVSDQTPLAKHVTTTDPPCETSTRNPGLQE